LARDRALDPLGFTWAEALAKAAEAAGSRGVAERWRREAAFLRDPMAGRAEDLQHTSGRRLEDGCRDLLQQLASGTAAIPDMSSAPRGEVRCSAEDRIELGGAFSRAQLLHVDVGPANESRRVAWVVVEFGANAGASGTTELWGPLADAWTPPSPGQTKLEFVNDWAAALERAEASATTSGPELVVRITERRTLVDLVSGAYEERDATRIVVLARWNGRTEVSRSVLLAERARSAQLSIESPDTRFDTREFRSNLSWGEGRVTLERSTASESGSRIETIPLFPAVAKP
jgi:hypothetical protein